MKKLINPMKATIIQKITNNYLSNYQKILEGIYRIKGELNGKPELRLEFTGKPSK